MVIEEILMYCWQMGAWLSRSRFKTPVRKTTQNGKCADLFDIYFDKYPPFRPCFLTFFSDNLTKHVICRKSLEWQYFQSPNCKDELFLPADIGNPTTYTLLIDIWTHYRLILKKAIEFCITLFIKKRFWWMLFHVRFRF